MDGRLKLSTSGQFYYYKCPYCGWATPKALAETKARPIRHCLRCRKTLEFEVVGLGRAPCAKVDAPMREGDSDA